MSLLDDAKNWVSEKVSDVPKSNQRKDKETIIKSLDTVRLGSANGIASQFSDIQDANRQEEPSIIIETFSKRLASVTDESRKGSAAKSTNVNDYKIYHFPEALINESGGQLNARYPHALAIFINTNSKAKTEKGQKSVDYTLTKQKLTSTTGGTAIAQSSIDNQQKGEVKNTLRFATYRRSSACIMLPVPLNVHAQYSVHYGSGGASGLVGATLGMALGSADVMGNFKDRMMSLASGQGKEISRTLAQNAAQFINEGGPKLNIGGTEVRAFDAIGGAGKIDNAGGLFDKLLGTAQNPRSEQLFQNVDFRTWSFSWNIGISSVAEWNSIRKIVSLLKTHMHPELQSTDSNGSYLVVPDEFVLEFYERGAESFSQSNTLPKIATCALTSLTVNYTPQGNWVAYEGTMIPPFVQISTNFKEIEPLHRDMVRDIFDDTEPVSDGSSPPIRENGAVTGRTETIRENGAVLNQDKTAGKPNDVFSGNRSGY